MMLFDLISLLRTRPSCLINLKSSICLFVKSSSLSSITSKYWSYAIFGAFKDDLLGDKDGGSIT